MISYRISILTAFINEPSKNKIVRFKIERVKKLQTCGYIFDRISLVFKEISTTFSLSVLIHLAILLIICTTSLYCSIFILMANAHSIPFWIKESLLIFVIIAVGSSVYIFIILISAESPLTKVNVNYLA